MKASMQHIDGKTLLHHPRKQGMWTQLFGGQLHPSNKWNRKAVFTRCPGADRELQDQSLVAIPSGPDLNQEICRQEASGDLLQGQLRNGGEAFLSPSQACKTKWNWSPIDY